MVEESQLDWWAASAAVIIPGTSWRCGEPSGEAFATSAFLAPGECPSVSQMTGPIFDDVEMQSPYFECQRRTSLFFRGMARVYIDVISSNFSVAAHAVLWKQCFGSFGHILDVRDDCCLCEMLWPVSEIRIVRAYATTYCQYKTS